MTISFSSLFSSVIALSLLIGILFLLIQKQKALSRFGIGCVYLLIFLILCRGFVPVEFTWIPLTQTIYSYSFLPKLRTAMITEIFSLGSVAVTPLKILLLIWIVGSVIQLCLRIKEYYQIIRYFKTASLITDESTKQIFQTALNTLYPNRQPVFKLLECKTAPTPGILGILRPMIILPSIDYTEEELYYVFLHELLHHKHGDFLYKLFTDLLGIIYWWNPLISRILFPTINEVQEIWVDRQLTKSLSKDCKIRYMQTLLKTLCNNHLASTDSQTSSQISFLIDRHTKSSLQQRFQYIIDCPPKRLSICGIVICLTLFVCSFTLVVEPSYLNYPIPDEEAPIFLDINGQTYYIRNGTHYDLYMEGCFVGTFDKIQTTFQDAPIYNSKEEVPINEN